MDPKAIDAASRMTSRSYGSFSEATSGVLSMLEAQLPGSAVFIGHLDHDAGVLRVIDAVGDSSFGLETGGANPIESSFCLRMATGRAPNLSNDVPADPEYGTADRELGLGAGSYLGVPLEVSDGTRIGSLCALAREKDSYTDSDHQLLNVMSRLLSYELEREARERELTSLSAQLREQALTDVLTGVANRRRFDEALDRQWQLARRGTVPSFLVTADLDAFKTVNDRFGHAEGDKALKDVADALSNTARDTDVVGRLGGDEFGVVLIGCEQLADAEGFCRRAAQNLATLSAERPAPVTVSFSCVALAACRSAGAAMEAADTEMYRAKRGRAGAGRTA